MYQCVSCESFWLQPVMKTISKGNKYQPAHVENTNICSECSGHLKIGGPIWNDPLHNRDFVLKAMEHLKQNPSSFNQCQKVYGLLSVCKDELDIPLYYESRSLIRSGHLTSLPLWTIRSAIKNMGFQVSGFLFSFFLFALWNAGGLNRDI